MLDRDKLKEELKNVFGEDAANALFKHENFCYVIRMACDLCFTFNITEDVETIRQASYNLHTYGNIHGDNNEN